MHLDGGTPELCSVLDLGLITDAAAAAIQVVALQIGARTLDLVKARFGSDPAARSQVVEVGLLPGVPDVDEPSTTARVKTVDRDNPPLQRVGGHEPGASGGAMKWALGHEEAVAELGDDT